MNGTSRAAKNGIKIAIVIANEFKPPILNRLRKAEGAWSLDIIPGQKTYTFLLK
jgi:hypothetical protein